MSSSCFKLAIIQMFVERTKELNHIKVKRLLREATGKGAKVVVLPEFFTCRCDPNLFREVMEPVPNGPTFKLLSEAAKENEVFLFGGSYPESSGKPDMFFNTSNIFNPRGELIGQHRKLHMYDVDLGPHLHITESHHIIPGNRLTVVKTDYCKIGVGICFDIQFPEMARIYRQRGCDLLIYMGAMTLKSGPVHWKVLSQARAADNQVYVAAVGPATDVTSPYVPWGHSSVASPWGEIIASCESEEAIVYADIDFDYLKEVRRMLPLESQRRKDVYKTVDLTDGTPV
ncbi:hypothetical protein ACJMK2_012155 [Sinanodonta woodiana]|uniref:omega-amidase n=1 Tax=Sinanodonta woodiana TaxID=1069815 RepID=A0ABD3V7A3_SINWO